jgi:hypothetical protein
METRHQIVLKHIETGMYWGKMAEPTKSLFSAMRFIDTDQCQVWLETTIYKPKPVEMYRMQPIKNMIEEEEEHE